MFGPAKKCGFSARSPWLSAWPKTTSRISFFGPAGKLCSAAARSTSSSGRPLSSSAGLTAAMPAITTS
jgi:hypothetical protein